MLLPLREMERTDADKGGEGASIYDVRIKDVCIKNILNLRIYCTKLEAFVDKTVRRRTRGQRRDTCAAAQQKSARFHAPFYPEIYTS